MNYRDMIAALRLAMHDHYTEPEGLNNCEGWQYVEVGGMWTYELRGPCTCGASKANERIESVIAELKKLDSVPT
jgi:hypothetical protein